MFPWESIQKTTIKKHELLNHSNPMITPKERSILRREAPLLKPVIPVKGNPFLLKSSNDLRKFSRVLCMVASVHGPNEFLIGPKSE